MSHEPPIPDAARSPYPLQPPPIASLHPETELDRSVAGQGADHAGEPAYNDVGDTLVDRARDTFDRLKESKYGLGAAIGIGSAALLAAVLYARRGSKSDRSTAKAAARPRRTARAVSGATGGTKPAAAKRAPTRKASAAPKQSPVRPASNA